MNTWAEQMRKQYAHIKVLPLEDLAKLPEAEEFDAGLYFLWEGDKLVYIGKSRNIPERRLRQAHINRNHAGYTARHKVIPHDRYTALVLEKGQFASRGLDALLQEHERAYLGHYMPPYNHPGQNGGT